MATSGERLSTVEIEPQPGPATAAVIWLHGLGADGHDFEPVVAELDLEPSLALRFVFPHAPAIPVTLNGGMVMPAWYDIADVDLGRRHDEAGILRSSAQVEALVRREIERGIPSRRVVLAGFSQGGAIALHVGLRWPEPLAGILALSTYLVRSEALEAERTEANAATPIFQAHGTLDPMVVFALGEQTRGRLQAWGHPVQWQSYRMQHQVCAQEIDAIGRWLEERLGNA